MSTRTTAHTSRPQQARRLIGRATFAALLALAAAPLWLAGTATPAKAEQDLKLVCPTNGGEPVFRNRTNGNKVAITDPQHKAMAANLCGNSLDGTGETSTVKIANGRTTPIYVNFTVDHAPGQITWGSGCTKSGAGAMIAKGATCVAIVANNNASSRFCADVSAVPADCQNAQANHQTMIETIFQPSTAGGCFNKGTCVWYDISVIPSTCTDATWAANKCAGTGGASYNLPVAVACGATTIYTCQGPATGKYGSAMYPSNCGNPYSTTAGGGANNQNAYFYPMFVPPESAYQPNTVCLGDQPLTLKFLSGS